MALWGIVFSASGFVKRRRVVREVKSVSKASDSRPQRSTPGRRTGSRVEREISEKVSLLWPVSCACGTLGAATFMRVQLEQHQNAS